MSQNVEVVRRLWAGLNENDPGLPWLPLSDEQIEIRNVAKFPTPGPYRGHEGVRRWVAEMWDVYSDVHHDLEELFETGDGETVVSTQRTSGHMRHTGIEVDFRWATVWTIKDGKASRATGYANKAQALEAVGLRE